MTRKDRAHDYLKNFWRELVLCGFIIILNAPILASPIDEANDPLNFGSDITKDFLDLPFEGSVDFTWSDDYWPTYRGGISYRWKESCPLKGIGRYAYPIGELPQDLSCLSPAEKFDLYRGDKDFTLTKFERNRTEIMKTIPGSSEYVKDFKIEPWEGICHAWAPALINYQTPKPILLTNPDGIVIPFGASDIKALLSFGIHLADGELSPALRKNTVFVGNRCRENFKKLREDLNGRKITLAEYNKRMNDPDCGEDVNAGAFHIVLANMLGIKKTAFTLDRTRDSEVWNQPIISYETKVLPTDLFRLRAGATPGAQSQRRIQTKIKMVVEVAPKWHTVFDKNSIKEETYDYWIDLNWRGEIIGGTWISENRPDFLWANTKVSSFEGIMTLLEPIYKASIEQQQLMVDRFRVLSKKLSRRLFLEKETQNEFLNRYKTLFADKKNFTSYLYFAILDAVEKNSTLDMKKIRLWVKYANVNARRDKDPENFMLLNAIKLKNLELVTLLVEAKANPEGTFYWAVASGNMDIINYLLSKGVKATERSKTKWGQLPALFSASLANNLELLNLLLDNGGNIDINLQDTELETPLIWALRGAGDEPSVEALKTISLLLKNGADPNLRNQKLYSALSIVKGKSGRIAREMETLLLKYNAKI